MASKWSREETTKYIECVKKFPCLYFVKCNKFFDRNMKAKAFNEILAQMRECRPNITLEEVKTKLRILRTQYLREKWVVDRSIKSGDRNIYIPKLWCYDQLEFLKNHSEMISSDNNMEGETLAGTTSDSETNDSSASENGPSCSKKRKYSSDMLSKFDEKLKAMIAKQNDLGKFHSFGEDIGRQLKDLPVKEAYTIMADLQEIISRRAIENIRKRLAAKGSESATLNHPSRTSPPSSQSPETVSLNDVLNDSKADIIEEGC